MWISNHSETLLQGTRNTLCDNRNLDVSDILTCHSRKSTGDIVSTDTNDTKRKCLFHVGAGGDGASFKYFIFNKVV